MAKKDKGSNSLTYNVTVYQTGVQRLDGEIVSISDGLVTIKHRKGEGSSSYVQSIISMDNVVGIDGGPGKMGSVLHNSRTVAFRAKKATVEPGKNGMLLVKWSNNAGREMSMSVRPQFAEVVTADSVDRPEAEGGTKKKKAKKKDKG